MHGAGGEWRVERQRLSWPILDAFRDAAEELGIPKTDDFNDGDNEGSGYFEVNQKGGLRWNTTKAFLRPAMKRGNLRVLTGAETERLEFDGKAVSTGDASQPPEIRPNYLSTAGDRLLAAKSIRHARRLMGTRAIARFNPQEMLPGQEYESDEDLIRRAGDIATTIFHPVGTCKMGSDPMAVVDAQLHVHGVAKLRVVDASIMPSIVSGNTNSPVIMIAEKAAEAIIKGA